MPPYKQTILVMHDDSDFLDMVRLELGFLGLHPELVSSCEQFLHVLDNYVVAAIIIGWPGAEKTGEGALSLVAGKYPHIPTIVITAGNIAEIDERCIKQGAFDVISKPVDLNRLTSSVQKGLQFSDLLRQNRQLENYLLGGTLTCPEIFENIITRNPKMLGLFKIAETIGLTGAPVLITGEPGVGKRVIAQAIHSVSRQNGAFISLGEADFDTVNCNEFLPEPQSDTGNVRNEDCGNLLSAAQGGTLFIGGIDKLTDGTQAKLLSLLRKQENCSFSPNEVSKSGIRIMTALCVTIEEILAQETIGRDLYRRLSIHHIHIPPLDERREDIPLLAHRFLKDAAAELKKRPPQLTDEAVARLMIHDYPENVRELKKILEKAVSCNTTGFISSKDLPFF